MLPYIMNKILYFSSDLESDPRFFALTLQNRVVPAMFYSHVKSKVGATHLYKMK